MSFGRAVLLPAIAFYALLSPYIALERETEADEEKSIEAAVEAAADEIAEELVPDPALEAAALSETESKNAG